MKLFIHTLSSIKELPTTYVLSNDNNVNIEIEDSTFIDLEIESDKLELSNNLNLIIGNTSFRLDSPNELKKKFYYKVDINHILDKLPGFRTHITDKTFETKSGRRQFTKLFLNEIGLSKIYIGDHEQETFLGSLRIYSSKINYDNYSLVTEYLLMKGYFDSYFLYKVTLDTQPNELNNSLLEALRKLLEFLRIWENNLMRFRMNPISLISSKSRVNNYDDNKNINNESIEWLIENADNFLPAVYATSDFKINKKYFEIERILSTEHEYIFDSYENRIIHGFISNLIKGLVDKESLFKKTIIPRTRLSNFKDFLINCFNNLLQKNFTEAKKRIFYIQNFFKRELPVTNPIYEFPRKVDGFYSKKHYHEVLKLIAFSKRIFALDFGERKFSLEIESFDKLFEVYCFYLIQDVITENFSDKEFKRNKFNADVTSNKLAGQYSIILNQLGFKIDLYYECSPIEFIQFTNPRTKYRYNPDFILAISYKGVSNYLIFDAKYKTYNPKYLEMDLENLTLKYLHKMGVEKSINNIVIGLFPISLGTLNKRQSIFSKEFDIHSKNPCIPQIGNIEIDPKSFNLTKNGLLDVIHFGMQTIKNSRP